MGDVAPCHPPRGDESLKVLESIESRANHEAIELEREQGFASEFCLDDATLVLTHKEVFPACLTQLDIDVGQLSA